MQSGVVVVWPELYNVFTPTTKQDYQTKYKAEFNGSDDPFRYSIVVLFRLLVLLDTTISATTITYYVSIFAGYMLTSEFVDEFVIGDHIIFAGVSPDETKRIIGNLTRFCRSLQSTFITKKAAGLVDVDGVLGQNIQLFVTVCSNYFRVAYDSQDTSFKDSLLALQRIFVQTHQAVPDDSSLLVGRTKTRTPKGIIVQKGIIVPKDKLKSTIRKPDPKLFDDKFQPKLDERVKHYIDLLNSIEWNETTLFPLLCELYWETASDPQLNKRKLLIINVFNAKYIPLDISVRDAMNKFFYTSSNSTMKDEKIISLLFLKFILYFATFILSKDTTKESLLYESLSHLSGLVGFTDNENILNGGTGIIANFLKNTKQRTEDLQTIIGKIHTILAGRSIAVPDTISLQSIIPKICRFRMRQLRPGVVTDSDDDDDDMGEVRPLHSLYSREYKPPQFKLTCPYRYKCNRSRDAKDGDESHFAKFSHPPGFKHIEDRRPHWRPGGGSGKSTRTRRRLSTKRTRRRPSTKRSTKRR